MTPTPDPLDPLLERWRSAPPPPPSAEELSLEVWRRIADAEGQAAETGWFTRLETTFSRPSFAFAFVAACMLLGLFLAEVRLSRQQQQRNMQLAHAYIQLIDPLLQDTATASATSGAPSARSTP